MKKSVCLYFQVHQPTRLRTYRFFDIGKDSHYYDDFDNRTYVKRMAQKCYLPMNALILDAIKGTKGAFKVAFAISGTTLEQFDRYAPEVIDSFRELAATGKVEFLAGPYYHSLAALNSEPEFAHQVKKHELALNEFFGVKPTSFMNTELIYSDTVGKMAYNLGYKSILTEGARHIMGWKSANYVYSNFSCPKQSLLLRNYELSDAIASSFSAAPVTAEQFVERICAADGDVVNLGMSYDTFGEFQPAESGIFDFMKALPQAALAAGLQFLTPSEVAKKIKPQDALDVFEPISWTDEERDVTAWLGNDLQSDAFGKLYSLSEKLYIANDPALWEDYGKLQESNHFHYMSTKFFANNSKYNPYPSPYEAFINYMNAVSDFIIRVDEAYSLADGSIREAIPLIPEMQTIKKAAAKKAPAKKAEKKAPAKKVSKK